MNTSKQSAGWVIDLRHKVASDIFLSTRIKIISFVILLTVVIVIVFSALITYLEQLIYTSVTEALNEAVTTGTIDPTIFLDTSTHSNSVFYFVLFSVIALATIAGVIAARVALEPVAHALDLQKKFIGSAAHELRTPMAILKTNNEVALFDLPGDHPLRSLLEENIDDINHVTEIINNLLLLHRTNAFGSMSFEKVETQTIIERVEKRLAKLAETRGITLSINKEFLPSVYGNTTGLEQVFFNLIKNAILYTPAGGTVTITKGPSSSTITSIQVSDTGIGIPKTDFPHIFEPFYRSENSAQEKGSGFGLAIVFEIVKLHGGTIMIQTAKQKGTSFTISLPRFIAQKDSDIAEESSVANFDFSNKTR